MLRDVGELSLVDMDESNVPIVCHLLEPEYTGGPWTWIARNFMPRREVCGNTWVLEADTKEEILEAVRKHVVPLYEAALENLKVRGENCYWVQSRQRGGANE